MDDTPPNDDGRDPRFARDTQPRHRIKPEPPKPKRQSVADLVACFGCLAAFGSVCSGIVGTMKGMSPRQIVTLIGGVFAVALVFMAVAAVHRRMQRVGLAPVRHETHRLQRRRALRGKGLPPAELAERLGVRLDELRAFTPRYTEVGIPKRRGGVRLLHVPDRETKAIQRRVLRRLLAKLRCHDAATGFRPGVSIVENALVHSRQCVVIKLDVRDFFPSTSAERIQRYFQRVGWDRDAAALLTRLTTHEGGLPQGAPTSPALSNLVNVVLDAQIARAVQRRKGWYTRYADDVTVSFPIDHPRRIRGVIQAVRRTLKRHGYDMHHGKTQVLRRHQRQTVTGLVVNDTVHLPRELRRRLRAARHRRATGREATWTDRQLDGYAALEAMIDQRVGRG